MPKPTVEQAAENVLFYVEHFMKTGRLKDAGFYELEQWMKILLELREEEGNAGSTGDWLNGEVTLIAPLVPVRPTEPETVAMEKEYAALPAGSVVAATGMQPWTKSPMGRFVQGGYIRTITELAGAPRQILRWGWGE